MEQIYRRLKIYCLDYDFKIKAIKYKQGYKIAEY